MRALTIVTTIAVVVAVSLVLIPTFSSSAEDITVHYEENNMIDVSFPDGKTIEKGGTLVIIISSDIYDIENSSINFCERDENGNTLWYTNVTPLHSFSSDGTNMTYTFSDIETDIEIIFSHLEPKEGIVIPVENKDGISTNNLFDDIGTTLVLGVAVVIAALIMVIMLMTIKRIESYDTRDEYR